jgi:hypothetical protein
MQHFLQVVRSTWRAMLILAVLALVLLWLSRLPLYWAAAGVGAYYLLIAAMSPLVARAERRRSEELLKEIGKLIFSESDVIFIRNDRRQKIGWADVESVVFSESGYGSYGEDNWMLRGRPGIQSLSVPDYPNLTEPLLEWCARKLEGFNPDAYGKALRTGVFKNQEREPVFLECWTRTDTSSQRPVEDSRS